ncbi:hypothetical protein MML48_6g00018626 [Holotrichia oblita]|uniref:Uncharacterized protein n=1 Tax=Holotrichia oblita TaxID=644536 RepID=A0ACB9T052_HOLOL|nr:hypothetical protein MML48_6g00018626 [Holotrichia oblita]
MNAMAIFTFTSIFLCAFSSSFAASLFRTGNEICVNNLCNSTANYPEADILKAVSKNSSFSSMFGTIIQPTIKLRSRFMDNANMCPTTTLTYTPRIGKNINGEEKTIVNIDGYTQFITVELCGYVKDAKCFENAVVPDQDDFECQTHYVIIRLVVYNSNGELDIEHFPLPAGCYCSYKSDQRSSCD